MGYGLGDTREWALKWIEGSLISFLRGRTPLNMLIGRIERAIESYGVSPTDVLSLIALIENSPLYLPSLPAEEKKARLKPVKEVVEKMSSTAKSST